MPVALTSLFLHVGADTRDAESGLGRVNDHMGRMGGIVGGVAATFTGGMAAIAGGVLGAVGSVRSFIDAASESQTQTTRLVSVLQSTKGAAGLTRDELEKLSDRLSYMSGVDDEVVTSAESMLLTFTNIHKNVFPAAAEAALNLGSRFGNVEQASILVGKALQDPIRGMGALHRVGIDLSEQQKNSIKDFVAQGNIMGAQKVILGELNTQFGGLAKNMGQTLPGAMGVFKTQAQNVKEAIGNALGEPLRLLLIDRVNPVLHAFAQGLPQALDVAGKRFIQIRDLVKQELQVFAPLKQIVKEVQDTFKPFTDYVLPGFLQNFQGVNVHLSDFTELLDTLVQGALQQFADIWVSLGPALAQTMPIIADIALHIGDVVKSLAPLLGLLDPVVQLFKDFLPVLAPLIPVLAGIADQLLAALARNLAIVSPAITHLITVFETGLAPILKTLIPVIADVAGVLGDVLTTVLDTLGPLIATVADALAQQLGPILEQLAPLIEPIIEQIGLWIEQMAQDLMPLIEAVGSALKTILPPVLAFLGDRIKFLLEIVKDVWPLIQTIIDVALRNIGNVIKLFTDLLKGNWGALWDDVKKIATDSFTGLLRIVGSALTSVWNLIKSFITPIMDAVLKPFGMARDTIGSIWKALGNIVVDSVNSFVVGSFNAFIGNIAKAVDFVTDKLGAGKPLGNAEKGLLGNLPHFAKGGTSEGGLAWVGEEGAELAAFPAGTRIFSHAQSLSMANTGGTGMDESGPNPLGDLFNGIADWFIKGTKFVVDQAFNAFKLGDVNIPPFGNIEPAFKKYAFDFLDKMLSGGDISGALHSPAYHWWMGHIIQGYHDPRNPAHGGIDFHASFHTPLAALLGGTVYRAGYYPWGGELDLRSNLPGHGPGLENYTHLDLINPAFFHVGAYVPSGATVGLSGAENPGYPGALHPAQRRFSGGPHFHYNWFDHAPWAHDDLNPTPFIMSLRGGGTRRGFANGGWITEPVVGIGAQSGATYTFGERGAEYVLPNGRASGAGMAVTIYATSADSAQLAADVAREIYWQQVVRGR